MITRAMTSWPVSGKHVTGPGTARDCAVMVLKFCLSFRFAASFAGISLRLGGWTVLSDSPWMGELCLSPRRPGSFGQRRIRNDAGGSRNSGGSRSGPILYFLPFTN